VLGAGCKSARCWVQKCSVLGAKLLCAGREDVRCST